MAPLQKKKVAYIYDADIGDFSYGEDHVMKPHRVRITDSVVQDYGLYKHMDHYRPTPATELRMTQFHTDDYISHLKNATPETAHLLESEQLRYSCGDSDCPIFDDLFTFCATVAGGTVDGAALLGKKDHEIAIHWAGGLHHARKDAASGFCYVNDIVLGILELLRKFQRVLYIDIDVHHGDGVEEAFYTTDRVMTVSFHYHGGDFFPRTGHILDVGLQRGAGYAVNVPLSEGTDDASYKSMFEPIIGTIMECYRPDAVVLQCGADSLSGDYLGAFNLSMRGHAECVKFVKDFNTPLLVLGGGGYSVANVARAWTFETGVCLDLELDSVIPKKPDFPDYDDSDPPMYQGWKRPLDYYNWFGPYFDLEVRPSNRPDCNPPTYLEKTRTMILENIRRNMIPAPSVQMTAVPADREDVSGFEHDADEDENPDVRHTHYRQERHMFDDDNDDGLLDVDDEEVFAAAQRFLQMLSGVSTNVGQSTASVPASVLTLDPALDLALDPTFALDLALDIAPVVAEEPKPTGREAETKTAESFKTFRTLNNQRPESNRPYRTAYSMFNSGSSSSVAESAYVSPYATKVSDDRSADDHALWYQTVESMTLSELSKARTSSMTSIEAYKASLEQTDAEKGR